MVNFKKIIFLLILVSFRDVFALSTDHLAKSFYLQNHKYFQKDHPEVLTSLKNQYGSVFTEKLIDLWTDDLTKEYNNDRNCADWIGTCDFYLCQEKKLKCGSSGYNLGFGYKYCSGSRFSLYQKMNSPEGKKWVLEVFQCLQKQNLKVTETKMGTLTCQEIKQTSYDSHPDCYVNSGFCELPIIDQAHIMQLIKKELFSMDTIAQGVQILEICHQRNSHE